MLGRHLEDAQESARPWNSPAPGQAEAAAELAGRIADLTGAATGADGAIRVTVTSTGLLSELELEDAVQRLTGGELSAEILRVVCAAQAALSERIGEVVEQTVGADSETGRAVLDGCARRFPVGSGDAPAGILPPPPPFPTFRSRPTLPHQSPGVGFASGRDSRAR